MQQKQGNIPESPFIPFSRIKPFTLLFSVSVLPHTTNTSAMGEFVILKK